MANLGNITFNRTRYYGSGWAWSAWKSGIKSAYAGYTTSGGTINEQYHIVDEITLPSFTNAQYTAPYEITVSANVLKGNANASSSGTANIWLYDSDPTTTNPGNSSSGTADPPSGYIGHGSVEYSGLTVQLKDGALTIKITTNTDLQSGGTYYLWIDTTKWTSWQYNNTNISGTLSGTIQTYTITYNANGGTGAPAAQTKTYETTLTLSTKQPTRTGYVFNGWKDSSGNSYSAGGSFTANANTTLTAQWTPRVLTVKYRANGGTQGSGASYTLPHETTANYDTYYNGNNGLYDIATFKLSKTGHEATYWNTKADGTGSSIDQTTAYLAQDLASACGQNLGANDVTLNFYPKWTAKTYTVTYNANGGSGTMTASTATYNEDFRTKQNAFSKTGYTFIGWKDDYDTIWDANTAGTYENGNYWKWTYTENITLYAQWSINTYQLHVNPDGGTWNGSTSAQTIDLNYGSTQTIPVPTKTGYTFGGWAWTSYGTMNKSKFACSILSSQSAHGITIYNNKANGAVTHTYVSGSSDKGKYGNDHIIIQTTGTASPGLGGFYQTVISEYNSTYYHTFYAKLPVGYYFTYHNNDLPTGSSYEWLTNNSGSGQWQIYAYKLTTGSSGPTSTFGFIAANANSGSPTTVTWYLGANQITKSPTSAQTFTMGAGNSWIYPLWIPNRYTVVYNGNSATSGSTASSLHTYDMNKKLTANGFIRPGYEFVGWATNATGNAVYANEQLVKNLTTTKNGTVNLYAVWEPSGTVRIWNGSQWVLALPFIYAGASKGWIQAIPYTYTNNTDKWKLCGG